MEDSIGGILHRNRYGDCCRMITRFFCIARFIYIEYIIRIQVARGCIINNYFAIHTRTVYAHQNNDANLHMSLRRDCCDKTVLYNVSCLIIFFIECSSWMNPLTHGCMGFTIFRHPIFYTSFRRRPFADFLRRCPLRQNNARIPAPPPTPFGDVLRHIPTVTHTLTTETMLWVEAIDSSVLAEVAKE